MRTIAEIREKFPQYSDLSDSQLADALYKKYYADLPRNEFDSKIGLKPAPVAPQTDRTWFETFKDVPASALTGVGGLLQFPGQLTQLVPGLSGVGQAMQKPGEYIQEFGKDLKSTGLRAREALRSQAISEAEKDGFLSEFATAITSTIKDPALIVSFVTEQVPLLLGPAGAARLTTKLGISGVEAAGAAAAKGLTGTAAEAASKEAVETAAEKLGKRATAAAIGTGTAMQAGDVGSDTYKEAYKRAIEMGMSPQEAESAALNAARIGAGGAALTSLGANLGLSKIGGTAIERALAGRPGQGRIKGFVGESISEGAEEGLGKVSSNIGMRTVDPNQSLMQGVGSATGMGVLGGGLFGTLLSPSTPENLAAGQRPGESLYQTATRLNKEIKNIEDLAQMSEKGTVPPSGVRDIGQLFDLASTPADQGGGYAGVQKYLQTLNDMPASTERDQAISDAKQLLNRMNIESTERQTQTQTNNVITAKDLQTLGFKYTDPIYKELLGKNIGKPDDAQAAITSIENALQTKGLRQTQASRLAVLRQAIDLYLETVPGGGFYAQPSIDTTGGDGAGVAGVSGAGAAPAGVGVTEPSGVVPPRQDAEPIVGGKAKPTAPITEEEIKPQEAPVVEEVVEEAAAPEETAAKAPAKEAPAEKKFTVTPSVSYLPKDLLGAKPRYAYGDRQFQLQFGSDIDKALYITAQKTPSKRDADYRSWLVKQGFTPEQITTGGQQVREAIKTVAKDSDPAAGPIKLAETVKKPKPAKKSLRAEPLTEQDLTDMGVRKTAPAFKKLVGKTVEEGRAELDKYRSLPDRYVSPEAKRKIAKALGEEVQEAAPEPAAEEKKAPAKETTQKDLLMLRRAELITQLEGVMKKILAKYNLKGITLNLEEGMKDEGSYSGQIIKIALDLENPVRVLRHESIHALKDMGFFSDAQWNTLVKKAQDEWVQKYLKDKPHTDTQSRYDAYVKLMTEDGLSTEQIEEAVIEEAIADAFGDFDVNGAPAGLMTSILRRMKNLFKAIKEAFGIVGIDTAEEIFGKVEKGSLKPAIPMGKEKAAKTEAEEKLSLRGVVAEVAPNPDIPVAASWRQMTQAERLDATKSVAKKVIDPILSDIGLKGYSFKFSSGKYEGEVNPNILIEAPESASVDELEELARVVGYILDQKAMVAYDEYNTDSGDQAGFVKVMIPAGMDDKTITLLRNHISKEVPQADGDTLRDGSLVYGNFSAYNDNVDTLSDKEYHDAIVRAIEDFDYDGSIKVSDPLTFHSQLVWPDNRESYLEGTRYGESGKIRGGEGSDVWRQRRSRLEAISEQAIALRDRWIDARGAARIGGRAGDSAAISTKPTAEYGKSIDGSETAVGVHFSQQPRATLDSQFYGAGLRGMERERLEGQPDIRNRIYFYVDTGKGVFPEAGVGGSPHVIRLNNLYNVLKDDLGLVKKAKGDTAAERSNAWERAIKNAGFDGYFFPDPLQRQGYAVLIGKHRVETKLSLRSQSPEFKFWFGQSKIVDKDGKPKVMYHGLAKDTTDFTRKTARGAPIFLTDDPKFAEGFAKDSHESIARNPKEFLSKEQIDAGVKRAIAAIRKDYGKDSFGQGMIDSLKTGSLKSAFPEALEYVKEEFINLLPIGPHIMPLYVKADYPFDYENADHVKQVVNILNQTTDSYGRMLGKKLSGDIAFGNWETIERGDVQDVIKELGFDSFYVKEGGKKNLAVYSPTQIKSATGNVGTYEPTNPDIRYSLRSKGDPVTRENVVDTMEMAQEKQPYMNCQLCVQMATGVSKLLDLPKVKTAQIGDIYTFNERKNMASHYAVDVGDGNVAEIEGWGEEVRVVPLSEVVDEYDEPSAIRRPPDTAYTGEKFSLRSTLPPSFVKSMDKIAPPRYEPSYAERITSAVSGDTYTRIRQKVVNRYERLAEYDRRVAAQIKQMGGIEQLADSKAESAALFSDLSAGILESVMGVHDRVGGAPIFKNGVTSVSNYGGAVKGLIEIFRPIAELKSKEAFNSYQTWAAVKRGVRLNAEGREDLIDAADVQAVKDLNKSNPDLVKLFESVQKDWLAYNNALVKYMKDTGVISPEMAKKYTEHGDYFPFYRLINEEDVAGPKAFSSIGNVKPPRKLKGGENPLGDFFENIVRNSQAAIQAGMKNTAAQRATEQAMRLGEVTRLAKKEAGVNVYRVFENGKEVYYRSHDPLFIEAIKSLNMAELPFIGLLAKPAAILRNLVTKDPAFMLANMMRDSLSAWATSGVKMTPIFSTFKNFGSALAGQSPEMRELYAHGILGGYDYSTGSKDAAREFEAGLRKRAGNRTAFEIGVSPATSLWGALEKGTQASDAATRIEVYKKVLAETGNEAEALWRALEVMNFNRRGNAPIVRILTAAVPFLNARMQGLDVLWRSAVYPAFGTDTDQANQRMKTFWVRGMTLLALSSMYWLMTHDDEEYKKQEQEVRDNNWLIPSLGIKIPIPFEVGVLFKVIPERLMELSFGSDTSKDFTDAMKRQFNSTFGFNLIPQLVLPAYEAKTNHSFFTDRPIIGKGLENVQDKYQIGPSTSRVAQVLGSSVGYSPMKLDHLIKGYTGTIGTYFTDLVDVMYDMNSSSPKPSKRFEQMPVIKRFALDPDARGTVTQYYKLKDDVDSAVRTANMLDRSNNFSEYTKYSIENRKLLASKEYINSIENDMKDYRDMKLQIQSAPFSAETKKNLLLAISRMESQTSRNIQTIKKFSQP